jgi:predicted DCC family thiol-disulfide oxidoreductase YuxK
MIEVGQKAYLLFDGDCGICTYFSEVARRMDRQKRFVVEAYQNYPETELLRFGLSYEQCAGEIEVITPHGRIYAGAFGLNYFLFYSFPWTLLVILIYAIPILLLLEVMAYAWVARNRHRLSRWFGLKACLLDGER